jgi:predicted metalloenzyme YecM
MSPEFHKHWVDIFNTVPSYQDPILELATRLGIDRQEAKIQHIAYLMNKDTTVCIMARNAYATTEQLAELVMSYNPKFTSVGEVLDSLEE